MLFAPRPALGGPDGICSPFCFQDSFTRVAGSDSLSEIDFCVWPGEGVPPFAVGLLSSSFSEISPGDVLLVGDGLEMVRVDTEGVSTEMVEFLPFWDGPDEAFVGESMGFDGLLTVPEVAVSVAGGVPNPA